MKDRWIVWLGGGVGGCVSLLVCGAFASVAGLVFHRTYEAQSWPETECEILGSRAWDDPNDDSDALHVYVSVRYRVGEVSYENQDQGPDAFARLYERDEAEAQVARYSTGSRLPCFYDPENPADSVLDRSMPTW